MPTYEYRRKDGSKFEIEQRITDPPFKICPTTGQPVKRLISKGAGLVFKGSGFYLTDYARAGNKQDGSTEAPSPSADNSTSKSSSENATESKTTGAKKETKSDTDSSSGSKK